MTNKEQQPSSDELQQEIARLKAIVVQFTDMDEDTVNGIQFINEQLYTPVAAKQATQMPEGNAAPAQEAPETPKQDEVVETPPQPTPAPEQTAEQPKPKPKPTPPAANRGQASSTPNIADMPYDQLLEGYSALVATRGE